jgi:hypothetical protein
MIVVDRIIVRFFIINGVNILAIFLGDSSLRAVDDCIATDLAELGNFAI